MNGIQDSNRRTFLRQLAAAGAVAPAFIRNLKGASRGPLRLASFGAGGMAWHTLDSLLKHPDAVLACVADVDSAQFARVKGKYPDAKVYTDWREMLAKERKNIDMVCVGTPDHMHAPQAMSSMRLGLPVYQQKPMAHDLFEIRKLTQMARKEKLITQMGIQIHSATEYRTATQLIQAGTIGKVKEVHSWSLKKWGDPEPLPDRSDPIPPTLNWDHWIGVAKPRPYLDRYYHQANWRKRIDFGTATFGDMGCHIYDPVFSTLQLGSPISVRSEGPAPVGPNWNINAVIRYVFPGTRFTADKTVNVTWYDGDERPPAEIKALIGSATLPDQGSIFVGTSGVMLLPHIAMPTLYPEAQFKDFVVPKVEGTNHYFQFVDAVLGKAQTSAGFDYSGPLTEAVLLGPLSTRFPKTTLEWDGRKLKFRNSSEATALVRTRYRDGWKVKGLS
jgi:predicted dehydrogenase